MFKIHSICMLTLVLLLAGCAPSQYIAAKEGDLNQVKHLLDSGGDVNFTDRTFGETPLHWAAEFGRKEIVELLLSRGAYINAKNKNDRTPLHRAAYKGHKEIVELLLSKGAYINAKNKYNWTPLHRAAYEGHKEIVELLLSKGANPNVISTSGKTPLQWAAEEGHIKIVYLLENPEKFITQLRLKEKHIKNQETLKSNLSLIQAKEKRGDRAKKAGHHKKALSHYLAAINLTPPGTDMDRRLKKKTISFVRSMRPKPPFPVEAKHHAMRGQAFLKIAKDREGYQKALSEFQKAVQLAPWWASGYFNLGLVQEKVEDNNGAMGNLKLYLVANPGARDAAAVEKKIIELEVLGEVKGK